MLTVREVLSYGVDEHIGARVELEELAMRALTYNLAEGFKLDDLREEVGISTCLCTDWALTLLWQAGFCLCGPQSMHAPCMPGCCPPPFCGRPAIPTR